jgi:putative redox protein
MELTINWKEKMAFAGVTPSGHEFTMDAAPEVGASEAIYYD